VSPAPIASKVASLTRALRGKTRRQPARRCPRPACRQPGFVADGPGGPVAVDLVVSQQKRGKVLAGTSTLRDSHLAGPAQIPHAFLDAGGDSDRPKLARPVQTRQTPAVTTVGLHLVTRGPGDERGCDDLGGHAH